MIAGHYTLQYPEQVEKLFMMSAVGVQEKPDYLDHDKMVEDRRSAASRYGATWVRDSWTTHTTAPADLYRMLGYGAAKKLVINGIMRRMRSDIF